MLKRIALIGLIFASAANGVESRAKACALPAGVYDPANAAAAVTAIVSRVRGSDFRAIYNLRRTAIVIKRETSELPDQFTIKMAEFIFGTCGAQSPLLSSGDKVIVYFELVEGELKPRGWKILS